MHGFNQKRNSSPSHFNDRHNTVNTCFVFYIFVCTLPSVKRSNRREWSHYPHADADVHSPERRSTAGEFPAKNKHKASKAVSLLTRNRQHNFIRSDSSVVGGCFFFFFKRQDFRTPIFSRSLNSRFGCSYTPE